MGAFDYSQFASENDGTPELIKYHQKNLEKFGIKFGRGSFAMVDLHTQETTYTLKTPGLELTGGVDAGVILYGVARAYAGIQNFYWLCSIHVDNCPSSP